MRRFSDDDSGQLILIACVSVAAAIVLITMYGYSTLGTGENSINRENMNSYYYYDSIRDNYPNKDLPESDKLRFEKDLKAFALLHGYSVDFKCNNNNNNEIMFIDKDIEIKEEVGPCP